jgi:FkbM family methyltransferase
MTSLNGELERLLSDSVPATQLRQQTHYDVQAGPHGNRVVLFGAGHLGRDTLARLRRLPVEVLVFADNNPQLWGKEIDGLPVLSPADAGRRFGTSATFVVAILSPGRDRRFPLVRTRLRSFGCLRVVPFAALAWKYADTFLPNHAIDLPHKVVAEAAQVEQTFHLWADEHSRREYLEQLRWRLFLDSDSFSEPEPTPQYFPDHLVRPCADEVLIDCGAYDGDTIRSFLRLRGAAFGKIHALEPDPVNYQRLTDLVAALPDQTRKRTQTYQAAAGSTREKLRFDATGNTAAAFSAAGTLEVDCYPLDDLLGDSGPTFIKMDIEAAEPAAVAGAEKLIARHAPVMAVCVYHRQDHLWRIPLQLASLCDNYTFFLRRYEDECWEVVCYAVPRHRLAEPTHANVRRRSTVCQPLAGQRQDL